MFFLINSKIAQRRKVAKFKFENLATLSFNNTQLEIRANFNTVFTPKELKYLPLINLAYTFTVLLKNGFQKENTFYT